MSQSCATLVHSVTELKEFKSLLKQHDMIVANFGASWCGPCKQLRPFYFGLPENFPNIHFVKIDVDHDDGIGDQEQVQALPTTLFFYKSTCVERIIGSQKEKILNGCTKLSSRTE